jgi:hypothetical protein
MHEAIVSGDPGPLTRPDPTVHEKLTIPSLQNWSTSDNAEDIFPYVSENKIVGGERIKNEEAMFY